MRKEDFYFNVKIKKSMEFSYNNLSYSIRIEEDEEKNPVIYFGRTYQEEKYDSYGEFMNTAKVENSFFKDLLEDLDL